MFSSTIIKSFLNTKVGIHLILALPDSNLRISKDYIELIVSNWTWIGCFC
jgi:hypothetical protein